MLNLLSNASKFTLKGYIKIKAELIIHEESDTKSVKISVSDSGIGIKDNEKNLIFDSYTKLDYKENRILNP